MKDFASLRPADNDLREAEQHAVELLRHLFEVNRRDLFKLLGAGLAVGICRPSLLASGIGPCG